MRTTAMLSAVTPSQYTVPLEELVQYGAMGTIIHKMAEMALLNEGDPTMLWEQCKDSWDTVQKGSLNLNPSDANPQAFIEKYKEDFDWHKAEIEIEMYDDDLMVKGTTDLIIPYKGELSIADWKTSRSYSKEKKEHYFKQLAMYAILCRRDIKYLVICPLNPNNKSGYGKPIETDEVEKYKQLALKDLEIFNKKYRCKQSST